MWTRSAAHELIEQEESRTVPLHPPDDDDPGLWIGIEVSNRCHIDGHVNAHGEVEFDLAGRGSGARISFERQALRRLIAMAIRLDRT